MKSVHTLIGVALTSVAVVLSVASPVLAWHPEGAIKKEVQNLTANGQLSDANSAAEAVSANPGDTLKYVITVRNDGKPASNGYNDMHFTKVVDQLPAGVEIIEGDINAELGVITPGKSKSYAFTVKVTSQQKGDVICNTASFTGDSKVKDAPQRGSNKACVKVNVPLIPVEPQTPEEPKKPETPEAPKPEVPKELPSTGPGAVLSAILGTGALAGASHAYLRSRRFLK